MRSNNDEPRSAAALIETEERWGAHNYLPLDVVVARAQGVWVYDVDGRRYMDCLSAYSAASHGHAHPRLLRTLQEQAAKVTLTSRAFRNDQLPPFSEQLARLCGKEAVLPMNTGAEAVETAIKLARRWGYRVKAIAADRAEIIVCDQNFHGRTTTIVGFSSEPAYREDFGPFTPGFRTVPFGDLAALERAITRETCAFLVEPIQCEAGVRIPPDGYLAGAAALCRDREVLFLADEIQTGLGRVGRMFGCDAEAVEPDLYIVGKALGGGVYPVSAVVGNRDLLDLFTLGSHGSTFGGNPLACAVARTALDIIVEEKLPERSAELGSWLLRELQTIRDPDIREVRGRGLIAGIDLSVPARPYCERLAQEGVLCKETHDHVIRIAPPLIITENELEWALDRVRRILNG